MALCQANVFSGTGKPVPEEGSHTHTYPDHQSSFICFLHLLIHSIVPVQFMCLTVFFAQPLSESSLV